MTKVITFATAPHRTAPHSGSEVAISTVGNPDTHTVKAKRLSKVAFLQRGSKNVALPLCGLASWSRFLRSLASDAMGERKVLNKYFPPDFDPSKIPKADRKTKERLREKFMVRMMLPMSVRCTTCGEYMYKGKKFNARKENVEGPDGQYLGMQILRFYLKCTCCSAEFTIRTDPKNMDYAVERGVTANFELYKAEAKEKDEIAAERAEGEQYDAMKKLENKTEESKRQMDILDALDEIRTNNARAASLGIDDVLSRRQQQLASAEEAELSQAEREDMLEAERAFAAARTKRLRDDDDDDGSFGGIGGGGGTGIGARADERQSIVGGLGAVASSSASAAAAASASSLASQAQLQMQSRGTFAPSVDKAASKRPKLLAGVVIQSSKAPARTTSSSAPAATSASGAGVASATATAAAVQGSSASGGGLLGLGAYGSSGSDDEDDEDEP